MMEKTFAALFLATATAFSQSRPPANLAIEKHDINGLFLGHLETMARHVQPPKPLKGPTNGPPGRPSANGPLTDDELLAIRPLLTAFRAAVQATEASIAAERGPANARVVAAQSTRLDQLHAQRKAAIEDAMKKLQAALPAASWTKMTGHIDSDFYKEVPRKAVAAPGK